jgi:hypothetical protein
MSHRLPTTVQPRNRRHGDARTLHPTCQRWVLRLGTTYGSPALRLFLWAPPRRAMPIKAAAGPCLPSTLPIVGKFSSP